MGKYTDDLNQKLVETEKSRYLRHEYQSFMTGPEWRNVEMAQELAAFLAEGRSMFQFPYFRQIFGLWRIVYQSYAAARKHNSISEIMFSEYMMMDIFVGFFTTMEYAPKGFMSMLLSPFLKAENKTDMQNALAGSFKKYGNDLETIPFYDQKYDQTRTELAAAYEQAKGKTWGDWFSWNFVSKELFARFWISKPLHAWYHSETNLVPPTTDVLVKFNVTNTRDPKQAEAAFREKLAAIQKDAKVEVVKKHTHEHVYVKDHKPGKSYTSVYALLQAPRYRAFQQSVKVLGENGIQVRKIAGQDRVQVKCLIEANSPAALQQRQEELTKVKDVKPLYTYGDSIHKGRQFCLFDVPAKNLHKTVTELNAQPDVKVNFIHNF